MVMAQANQASMIAGPGWFVPLSTRGSSIPLVVTRYPTHGAAQEAKMSLEEYEDYLFPPAVSTGLPSRKSRRNEETHGQADRVRIVSRHRSFLQSQGHARHQVRRSLQYSRCEVFTAGQGFRGRIHHLITVHCIPGKRIHYYQAGVQQGSDRHASLRHGRGTHRILDTTKALDMS